jgi:anion-transporting  ArsA/GET3 family ATPase
VTLRAAVEGKHILVVCGAGGVGKTSISAALALAAAAERKTIVLTIDPARRLATALGLEGSLGHEEKQVDAPGIAGSLSAAMLDMKTAWDELVERYAPSPEVIGRIRSNRLYQSLSEHFVGSQGYMAMERLADLHERGAYDLIVIDTPPTRHALDFLDAPKRMTDFVGGSLLRWFARPYQRAGRIGARAFSITASPVLKLADRVLGSQVLEDLSAFVIDFQTLYDGFKHRADEVLRLLHSPQTGFVVVTSLEPPPMSEAAFFLDRLSDERMPLAGVVANKVVPDEFASQAARQALRALDAPGSEPALAEARDALRMLSEQARRDADCIAELERRSRLAVTPVPIMRTDVHDLDSLRELSSFLV